MESCASSDDESVELLRQDIALTTDSLTSMMERERTAYACHDYLRADGSPSAPKVTPADRRAIVDWCYEVVDHCRFDRETVAVAMNLVDRFMGLQDAATDALRRQALRDRAQYQLVAVTALYVAIKLNERATLSVRDFAAISHGTYTVEDIEAAELALLTSLSWRLCPPTSLQAGYRILTLMASRLDDGLRGKCPWRHLQDEVAFQAECAARDYDLATRRPSAIAAAAVLNVVEEAGGRRYPALMEALHVTLAEFDFDPPLEILTAREKLHRLVDDEEGGSDDDTMSDSEGTRVPVVSADSCADSCATMV